MFGNINRVAGYARTLVKSNSSNDPLNTNYKNTEPNTEIDTVAGTLEFDNGVYGNILFTAGINSQDNAFVIYGSDANLICPRPQLLRRQGLPADQHPQGYGLQPQRHRADGDVRGPAHALPARREPRRRPADLAFAIRNGRKPRCHYSMGLQTFEVVHGLIDSCTNGVNHTMVSHVDRPAALRPASTAVWISRSSSTIDLYLSAPQSVHHLKQRYQLWKK